MTLNPVDLLRQLGSGVRPDGVQRAAQPGGGAVEALDFASLLRKAEGGELQSGRRVEIARDGGLTLNDKQIDRLSAAADAAEAAGATRLLALIDGQQAVVDLTTRTARAASLDGGSLVTGVDAAVIVPDEGSTLSSSIVPLSAPEAPRSIPPLGRVENRSLASLLERLPAAPAAARRAG